MTPFSLNIAGRLVEFDRPVIMGIINITEDSFFAGSRRMDIDDIQRTASDMIADGVDIIDIGACSTRPGSESVDSATELKRLQFGIDAIRQISSDIPISVDTFRADSARAAINCGANIINDISGGQIDKEMFDTVAELRVPYVLMHMRGTPADMQQHCEYNDVTADVLSAISHALYELSLKGVNDIIIDPGFGFSKTLSQNYQLLNQLESFRMFERPVLVGMSRKSMLTKLLDITADQALNATTAINSFALDRGADILRVHDVKAARQCADLYYATTYPNNV